MNLKKKVVEKSISKKKAPLKKRTSRKKSSSRKKFFCQKKFQKRLGREKKIVKKLSRKIFFLDFAEKRLRRKKILLRKDLVVERKKNFRKDLVEKKKVFLSGDKNFFPHEKKTLAKKVFFDKSSRKKT